MFKVNKEEEIMSEETKTLTEKKKNQKAVFLTVIILLVVVSTVLIYRSYQNQKAAEAEKTEIKAELDETYNKLQSISHELELKIQETEKLGGDITQLKEAQAQLEEEKAQLQNTANANRRLASQYRAKMEGYKDLLENQEKEIARLKMVNDALLTENSTLKEEHNELNGQIAEVKRSNEELNEKVRVASKLEAENISVLALNAKGRERKSPFRSKSIDKVKVEFNVADNEVAEIGSKEIMIKIVDPEGNAIFDVATGSGTFMLDNKESFYTAKQDILFDNSNQRVTFVYDKGSDYVKGEYQLFIYSDELEIGQGNFRVK
ncbi:chromosome segregation protein SMC [Xanthovirga aplysinae]|uniref:chromosome segregation protein SMC n=1 Tax=Xanthovirga aplysinae TaxID=2529853 RepID=UPI0012BB759C|nr:chromosome segregation protein SMC [Xanthovirga aplysinae]MTI30835.1 chromosome segregation protein SMC [Xanthovirga aplysinae]